MDNEIIFHEIGIDPMYKTWHVQNVNMIMYTYSGDGSIVFKDKIYPICGGALCFVGSEKFHYTVPDKPEGYDRSKIFITPENHFKILSVISGDDENKSFYRIFNSDSVVYAVIPPEKREEIEKLLKVVKDYEENKRYFSLKLANCYLNLLMYLDMYRCEEVNTRLSGFAYETINYINQHIEEDITIDDICSNFHISKYYFCRKFKKLTGQTVMEYILKTRISIAKNLLVKNIPIGEISEECGFSSVSYFSRAFKKDTGLTPTQYRREHIRDEFDFK